MLLPLPPITQHQLLITRKSCPLNHSLTSTGELMSMADTSPRLRLRMSTELSRESTELSFLTAVCRLCPTTPTMRMGLLLMSDTRERPTLSLYTRPPSTQWLITLFMPPLSFPTTLSTLLPWLLLTPSPLYLTMLSMPQLLLPSTTLFTLFTMRLFSVEMETWRFR